MQAEQDMMVDCLGGGRTLLGVDLAEAVVAELVHETVQHLVGTVAVDGEPKSRTGR
jgi:hypothetical protein